MKKLIESLHGELGYYAKIVGLVVVLMVAMLIGVAETPRHWVHQTASGVIPGRDGVYPDKHQLSQRQ